MCYYFGLVGFVIRWDNDEGGVDVFDLIDNVSEMNCGGSVIGFCISDDWNLFSNDFSCLCV